MKYDPEDPRITAYLFNELGDSEKQAFEELLAASTELKRHVEQTRATIVSLETEFAANDQLSLNDQQRETVRSKLVGTGTSKVAVRNAVNSAEASGGRRTRKRVAIAGISAGLVVTACLFWAAGYGPIASTKNISAVKKISAASERTLPATAQGQFAQDASDAKTLSDFLLYSDESETVRGELSSQIAANQTVHDQNVEALWGDGNGNGLGAPSSGGRPYKFALPNQGPQDGKPPITYPAPQEWSSLSERRKAHYSTVDPEKSVDEQKLRSKDLLSDIVGPPRVEFIDGTDVFIVRGQKRDVARVEAVISAIEDGVEIGDAGVVYERLAELEAKGVPDELARVEMRGIRADILRDRFLRPSDQGAGPGQGGDKFEHIVENDFLRVTDSPLSTFSIDVDTASYSKIRMYLTEHEQLPRPDAVRIEELVNYFPYRYDPPTDEHPFASHQSVTTCPWNPKHRLVRIGIKGKEIETDRRPASNLVFLLDVSGSMDEPNKLPLVKRGMKMLTDRLTENDRVAIVVYAGAAGLVLDSTTGDHKSTIIGALERLQAGGSTNGGQGIQLAYETALANFITGGVNRVILCTDGDFNVGTTGTDELIRMVEEQAKKNIFLSVLGFGMGNHNDSMLEQVSNKGNGNYGFVDSATEARKVFVEQMSGTLVTIAKDVKIQIEFNPTKVSSYRLIGYENRVLAAKDFNDDTKDAGEIGAGHTVTALYELVPVGEEIDAPKVDDLKYQTPAKVSDAASGDELFTLKLRYKQPEGDKSQLLTFPCVDADRAFHEADRDFQFAASVASFGMLLRGSKYKGNATFASVLETATAAAEEDKSGYRGEFLHLVQKASQLAGETVVAEEPASELIDDHGEPR